MVAGIVMYQGDAVQVQAVMEFFVDGVEVDDRRVRETERELEEKVRVSEDSFVDIESLFWG
jgi:hypothetical protein